MSVVDVSPFSVQAGAGKSGLHYISGAVSIGGVPASMRRVALIRRDTLELLAVTDSHEDGSVVFQGIPECPERSLLMIAMDVKDGDRNAYAADFLSLEIMP